MDITTIVDVIRNTQDCVVFSPQGLPVVNDSHVLTEELEQFYAICGGMDLFVGSAFPTRISRPEQFVLANPVILANVLAEEHERTDKSWSWYIVAYGDNSQYISVDLAGEGAGLYYNSFWIKHPGNSEVISQSLVDLLQKLLSTKGEYYWFDD